MRALPSAASSALLFLLATLSVQVRAFAPFGPSVVLRQQQQQQQRRAACGQKPTRSASSTYSVIHVKCSKAHARASALQAFGPGGGPGRYEGQSRLVRMTTAALWVPFSIPLLLSLLSHYQEGSGVANYQPRSPDRVGTVSLVPRPFVQHYQCSVYPHTSCSDCTHCGL
jgi:hypothetical protein